MLVVWVLLVASCVHGLVDSQRDMVGLVQHETLQHPKVKLEQHFVETADGYILGVFRLRNPELVKAPVVLLMHGLMDSSIVWVNNGRERSLGLVLAELGYDVWLGNNRGNAWSRRHVSLNPNTDSRFWDFSFDEMGEFDLPAVVDFCLQVSQQAKLTYVGHSQGSTQLIAALSTESGRQALGGKIGHFVGLAPAVFEFHMKSVLMKAMAEMDADRLTTLIGINEFAPSSKLLSTLLPEFCRANPKLVCEHMLDMVYGKSKHLNVDREDVFLSQFPSGTSSRNVQHWAQHTRQPVFQRFDFGRRGNLAKYGTAHAPHYDLGSFPTGLKTTLYFGENDSLQAEQDRELLREALPKNGNVDYVLVKEYSHVDFVWGRDSNEAIFPHIVAQIRGHQSPPSAVVLPKSSPSSLRGSLI